MPPARLERGSDPPPTPPLLQPQQSRGQEWWEALSGSQREGLILAIGLGFAGEYKWSKIAPSPPPQAPAHLWIRTIRPWRKPGHRQEAAEAPRRPRFALGLWEHPWR